MAGDGVHFSMANYEVTQFLYKCHRKNDERPFMTDVDVVCRGGYIPVHSPILMAASPMLSEHIEGLSRSEKEHMVIHLLDYDIADVTPVMQCLYTGRCLIARPTLNTIYEIFDSLGVPSAQTTIALGFAKEEDLAHKCCIRRYLDCDDDDELIDDEEILNEVENAEDVLVNCEPSPRCDDNNSQKLPPPVDSHHRHSSGESRPHVRGPGSSRSSTKAQPEQRKSQATKDFRRDESPVVDSGHDAVDEQENITEELHHNDDEMEEEEKQPEHDTPAEDEEQPPPRPVSSRRKRKAFNRASRTREKRAKKNVVSSPVHSNNSDDRDSSYTPAGDEPEVSVDEAEDDSEDLDLGNDDDEVADDFIVSDDASLEYGAHNTTSSEKSERRTKKERTKSSRTTRTRQLRRRPSSKSKSPVAPRRRLRQRNHSKKSNENKEDDDESDHPSTVSSRGQHKLRSKPRTERTINCPVCHDDQVEEFFELHFTKCGKKLVDKFSVKERDCHMCNKNFARRSLEKFARHINECLSKEPAENNVTNSSHEDEEEEEMDESESEQKQQQPQAGDDVNSSSTSDDDGDIDGEEMVTVQNSKSVVYVKLTRLSEAEFDLHYQKLLNLKADQNSASSPEINPSVNDNEATTSSALLNVLCGDESQEQHVSETEPLPSAESPENNHSTLHDEAELTRKWNDETKKCPQCSKLFQRYADATKCVKGHGLKRCWICFKTCTDFHEEFERHCKTNHSIGQGASDKCPICRQIVPWVKMENHIAKSHLKNLETVRRPSATQEVDNRISTSLEVAAETSTSREVRTEASTPLEVENEERTDTVAGEDEDDDNTALVRIINFSKIMEPDDSFEDRSQNNNSQDVIQTEPSVINNSTLRNLNVTADNNRQVNNVDNYRGGVIVSRESSVSINPSQSGHASRPTTAVVLPTVVSTSSEQSRNSDIVVNAIANGIRHEVQKTRLDAANATTLAHNNASRPTMSSSSTRTLLISPPARPPSCGQQQQQIILTSGNVTGQPSSRNVTSPFSNMTRQQPQHGSRTTQHVTNPESAIVRRPPDHVHQNQPYNNNNTVVNPSHYCGMTTINGVPFKVYQRPESTQPHPHTVLTVAAGSTPNGLPSSAPRLSITYPQERPLQHTSPSAPMTHNFMFSDNSNIVSQQNNNSALQLRTQPQQSDDVLKCRICDQNFGSYATYDDHICLDVD